MTRLNVSICARTAHRTLRAAALGLRSCREAFEVSSFAYLLRQAAAGMPLPERQPALAA